MITLENSEGENMRCIRCGKMVEEDDIGTYGGIVDQTGEHHFWVIGSCCARLPTVDEVREQLGRMMRFRKPS